jgi:hypothetical protein
MIYKTLHRKPKIGQHEPHLKPGITKYLLNDIGYMLKHVSVVRGAALRKLWGNNFIQTYPLGRDVIALLLCG